MWYLLHALKSQKTNLVVNQLVYKTLSPQPKLSKDSHRSYKLDTCEKVDRSTVRYRKKFLYRDSEISESR